MPEVNKKRKVRIREALAWGMYVNVNNPRLKPLGLFLSGSAVESKVLLP